MMKELRPHRSVRGCPLQFLASDHSQLFNCTSARLKRASTTRHIIKRQKMSRFACVLLMRGLGTGRLTSVNEDADPVAPIVRLWLLNRRAEAVYVKLTIQNINARRSILFGAEFGGHLRALLHALRHRRGTRHLALHCHRPL